MPLIQKTFNVGLFLVQRKLDPPTLCTGLKHSEKPQTSRRHCTCSLIQTGNLDKQAVLKRCYTQVHQAKRLQSLTSMVTNHDATIFPKIFLSNLQGGAKEPLRFDRVLADVPCSGDGTMRKYLLVWKEWNPMQANGLHSVQLRVLERGIQLAKEWGRIVYSTCALNPVANEAVVSAILSKFEGALELEDVSALLPGLVRIGGMQSWKVMDRRGNHKIKFIFL